MFNSETLEVAIGMVFLFLMMSIICTAIREWLEGLLRWRAKNLEKGVRTLLDDHGGELTAQLFQHPTINSLYDGAYRPKGRNLPSYIPAANFSTAFLDLVVRGAVPKPAVNGDGDASGGGAERKAAAAGFVGVPTTTAAMPATAAGAAGATLTIANLRAGAAALPSAHLRRFVLSLIDHADDDVGRARAGVEQWFDGTMDRVSGWYRRHTQALLFALGITAAVVMNVDALYVMERLTTDKAFRAAVVAEAAAEKASDRSPDEALAALQAKHAELDRVGMPIGWTVCDGAQLPVPLQFCTADFRDGRSTAKARDYAIVRLVLGWLVTAFAVMLGAPFWFDVLDKFMVVRSTVKPHEKSREEGSKDGSEAKSKPA